jgi:hypothetical protein
MANSSGFFDGQGNWWKIDHTQMGSGPTYTLQANTGTNVHINSSAPSGTITSGTINAYTAAFPNTAITFDWNIKPTVQILSDPEVLDKLISRMVTLYKPEDPLIICVEKDFTPQQVREFVDVLNDRNIKAVVIPGAHAGTGRPIFRPIKEERERIDILARIGEVWEQHPHLSLTELLKWWDGTQMNDDEFAAAVDVYMDGAA